MQSDPADPQPYRPRWGFASLGLLVLIGLIAGAFLDSRYGWVEVIYGQVAHLFYEVPVLAGIRRESQLALLRGHLLVFGALCTLFLGLASVAGRHTRTCLLIFAVAYAVRATIWVVGSNLPLVPGDSCHYVEVAASILRGEGPVKHYVESFFADYPPIRQGKGVLDDWATPLYSYALAGAYRMTGVDPASDSLESVLGVAKGTSFVLNLLCLPALYGLTRRSLGRETALVSVGLLAILPVHALYAAMELRESLVALTSILAIWFLVEMGRSTGPKQWGWTIAAGLMGGLAILTRNTAMALLAGGALYLLLAHLRRAILPLLVWGGLVVLVITPWALATQKAYGEPFYSYTKYFQYTFSWTVHHYQEGKPSAASFYTLANAPEIVRVKLKAFAIILTTSTMILSVPLVLAWVGRLRSPTRPKFDGLGPVLTLAFIGGTLSNVADITQVAQLGRYYLPLFTLLLPTIAAGLIDWASRNSLGTRPRWILGLSLVALLWSDPTWAYDYTWLVKPYQLHWSGLRESGDFIKAHPEVVPADARVMTWFPWEVRLASQRTTVLLPRSYQAQRIDQVIRQYGVTHVLWGSFESPPNVEPESWGRYLESVRMNLGLNERNEVFRSDPKMPFPVQLYRLRGTSR